MPTALVTGASSGIGHATAALLNREGWEVFGMARRTAPMPAGVHPIEADLSRPGAARVAYDKEIPEGRTIDALIHSAGFGDFGPLELTPLDEARQQLEVNLLCCVELVQQALPAMRDAHTGRIVLVSSIASSFSSPMGAWYHASKAALESVADALRQEVCDFGIDVSVIQPGVVRTPWHETALDRLTVRTSGTPYGQMGAKTADFHRKNGAAKMASEPDQVAETILRAVTAPNPRTRYLVGRGSRLAAMIPRLVPDKTFDRLTRRQFGIERA